MQVPWHPRVAEVESTLARKVYERVTAERQRELRGDRWRGFKIGAAMVGGGALLAVTGGLAAPAFAAGLAASSSIIGASAAATLSGFASTAWMATVFGATGAGLVGFKMDRRTKGVKVGVRWLGRGEGGEGSTSSSPSNFDLTRFWLTVVVKCFCCQFFMT